MTLRLAASFLAITIAAFLSFCSSAPVPDAADVPAIMAEASGAQAAPRRDSEAREAVRGAFRAMLHLDSVHTEEVGRRFQRPELRSYLMLPESYIGGDFPRGTAVLLREVQKLDREYLDALEAFPEVLERRLASTDLSEDQKRTLKEEMSQAFSARQRPVVEAVVAFDKFVGSAAELYELVARYPGSVRAMRDGLHITDGGLSARFNRLVDATNGAHDAADAAFRRLNVPEQQAKFTRMGVTKRLQSEGRVSRSDESDTRPQRHDAIAVAGWAAGRLCGNGRYGRAGRRNGCAATARQHALRSVTALVTGWPVDRIRAERPTPRRAS
jgi:hypothetical protein